MATTHFPNGIRTTIYDTDGNQVISTQQTAVADATDAATAITKLNAVIAALEAHGLLAS